MIVTVETKNRNWWFPRFGLNESRKVEIALKARYCRQFHDRFLVAPDKEMAGALAAFTMATPDDLAGQYVVYLVRRINLLKSRLDGASLDLLKTKPLPSYLQPASPLDDTSDATKKFGLMYVNYLVWRSDPADITKEITVLQTWLKQVISVKAANLHWLIDWANRQGLTPSLSLKSFWGGSRPGLDDVLIPPVFTRKGREIVTAFEGELVSAYPEPAVLEKEKANFDAWYRTSCYASWQHFATLFPKGEGRLNGAKEWQDAAAVMATDQGPYAAFLMKIVAELEPFGPIAGMPLWLQQVFHYQMLRAAGPASGAAAKAAEAGSKLAEKVGSLVGRKTEGPSAPETEAAAAKGIQEYQAALAAIAPAAKSRTQAYQLASQVFSEEQAAGKSPFSVASEASHRVIGALAGGRADDTFARLITGPLAFYWSYVLLETACTLQSQWEEKVLQEVQGASDPQMIQYLLGPEGPVWKYVKGPAGPFIGWTPQRGYYSKAALGGSVAFEPSFFVFLTKGAKAKVVAAPVKQNTNVTLRGLPTDANPDARIKPQSTRLELQCAAGPQVIENMNFPVSKTFVWSPDGCSDVTFQIDVGEVMLTKKYAGPQGFPAFLHDFPGGRHTFYPQDFPREKGALERMGIKYIRVNYQISGGSGVVAQASAGPALPGQAPRVVARCWN